MTSDPLLGQAALCLQKGDVERAEFLYRQVIQREPLRFEPYVQLAVILSWRGQALEAAAAFERALRLKPDNPLVLFNYGNVLNALRRPHDALESYDKALAILPDFCDALVARAVALSTLGRFEESLTGLDRAIALNPGHPLARADQGLGDGIQFARYLALLQDKGIKVILSVQNNLIRLLGSLRKPVEIVSPDGPVPDFDYQISLMSLPFVFRTALESIPADIPYLAAEPELVGKWKDRIGGAGFKVGIGWQGSSSGAAIGRSFPLSQYAGLSKIPGVRLISLQRHDEAGQIGGLPVEQFGLEFDGGADAFIDSAALMQSLDLIITPDTAIAHLAGALGRPVWVALKYVPDWRWLLERPDTPWYPTMRLFRQPATGAGLDCSCRCKRNWPA